jgi:hypothetical protein
MVDIIKAGQLPGEQVFTGTCLNCKTVARFKVKEATEENPAHFGGIAKWVIDCPLEGCDHKIKVDKFQRSYGYRD